MQVRNESTTSSPFDTGCWAFRRVLAASVLVVLQSTPGCTDGTGPDHSQPGAGEIAGSVTRHKTGSGVSDVVVVLVTGGRIVATAHTENDGRFRFGRLGPGMYAVKLAAMELAGLDPTFEALEPEEHLVEFDGRPADLVFTVVALVPPRITGEVFCGGTPVAGAMVRVVGGGSDLTVATNGQGKFGALDLSPGHYAVLPVSVPCTVAPGYHALEVRAGQARQADFAG